MHNRLVLGTVQFGLPYGVANQGGRVSKEEAAVILRHARAVGVDTLDTAIAYGDSEQRLGEIGIGQWQVISKLPAIPDTCSDVDGWVRESVLGSLNRLGVPRLRGLLLHRPPQLLGSQGDALYCALVRLKEEGKVGKIGVSIYGPDELDALWPRYQLDLVQAPCNILDRRLITSGWLARMRQAGTEVHVRSIFLQGLLLMDRQRRPKYFSRWQNLWDQWDHWLDAQQLSPLQACMGFALSNSAIDRIVVGVDSLRHLNEVLAQLEAPAARAPDILASEDLDLINPSHWNAN